MPNIFQSDVTVILFTFFPRETNDKPCIFSKFSRGIMIKSNLLTCGSVYRAWNSRSENPGSSRSVARYSTPGGDGRRSVAGTARGSDEAGEWGGPCPVVGARKILDLNSSGQLELRDRMIEVRVGATSYA